MSDLRVRELMEELDRLLVEAPEQLDDEVVAAWRERFDQAREAAERGPEWPALVTYAREVEGRLQGHLELLLAERTVMKGMLEAQAQGARALRAYKPGS